MGVEGVKSPLAFTPSYADGPDDGHQTTSKYIFFFLIFSVYVTDDSSRRPTCLGRVLSVTRSNTAIMYD